MPFFFSYEEDKRYRDGRRDAARGYRDHSVDCHFGDDADKAYCKGYSEEEKERERQREEEIEREREEYEAYERRREEERRRQEEEEEMEYYYEQQRRQEVTRQMLQDDMIGSGDF